MAPQLHLLDLYSALNCIIEPTKIRKGSHSSSFVPVIAAFTLLKEQKALKVHDYCFKSTVILTFHSTLVVA